MDAGPSRLELNLLGPPEVLVDGQPVSVDTRKAIALLAYLAERNSSPTRDDLAWLLWPESSPDRGRGALRRTISSLRSGLGGRWVEADRERVHLDRTDLTIDTAALGTDSGLDGVRGRFLDGFYLRDAAEFDDWQAATAEHYDRIIRAALEDRATTRMASGDHVGAITDAERRLAIDRLDESSHRLLMQALAESGDRAGAIRQYRACVAMLDEELAVEPLTETINLHEAILAGELEPPPTAQAIDVAPTPATSLAELDLADEADRLHHALAVPGSVAIVGPAGSGRTRVASAISRPTAIATAFPTDGGVAHGLSRSILETVAAGTDGPLDERAAPAVHLLPELARRAPEPPPLEGDLAHGRLIDGIVAAIATLLGERVLVVDDRHHADQASQEVVERLVERAGALDLRVVVTAEEAVGDREVRLAPMSTSAVESLADLLGHNRETATRVRRATGGWAESVVEALQSPDPLAAVASQRERRVAGLDPVSRQVLEALVVLGSGPGPLVAEVAGRPVEEAVGALDRLATSGLVHAADGVHKPGLRWLPSVVTSRMGTAREALLHGRAADALGDRPDLAAAKARHLELGGRTAEAALAHEAAGRHAAAILAADTARAHLETAIALGHHSPGELHQLAGDVETRAGAYPAAIRALNAAAAEGTTWEIERSIADVYARWGRWALAKASLQAALDLTEDASARASLLADMALVAVRSGDADEATATIDLALAAVDGDAETAARVANVAGLVLDDPEHLLRAIAHARRTDRQEDEAAALNNLALAYARRDRLEEAISLAERSLALLDRTGDRHRRAAIHGNLADLFHQAGNESTSQAHLKEAVTLFAEVGVGEWEPEIWKLTGW